MTRSNARRALLSVSDKTGIVDLARELAALGFALVSTGGTARAIAAAGLAVTEVSSLTGFPEIMDGRVKTLHPKVHGALLGRAGTDDAVMREQGIEPIDVLVINLYPFAETIARPDCRYEDAIENIDVGGPAMLRAAAKNHARVTVLVDPADYAGALAELRGGNVTEATRRRLAAKAFGHTAHYDALVSGWLRRQQGDAAFPDALAAGFRKQQDLRYGENPHQVAAFYADPLAAGASVASARQLQGKELSYNNIADADTAIECVRQFEEPACVIVKHANPCGVAVAASLRDAYLRAYEPDTTSAFGGIIAFNRPLDAETAAAIVERQFVEVIAAPSCEPAAREALAGKQNIRVLETGPLAGASPAAPELKSVAGGLLVQSRDDGAVGAAGPQGRDAPRPGCRRARGPAVRLARVQVREVERDRVREGPAHRRHRRRPVEPRRLDADRRDEGGRCGPRGHGQRDGLGRILSVPRRARRRGRARHPRSDPAGRVDARRRGHRRGRRARHRDGIHRHAALPALSAMKVLVIGGGGREHALAWKLAQSPRVTEVIVAPGNAGTALEPKCRNAAVAATDVAGLVALARAEGAGLTVVGPEGPLVAGVVDAFQAAGLPCFGPRKLAARLEGSKQFTKEFLVRHGIPTARYAAFTRETFDPAAIRAQRPPIVVKADGLAAGKGVIIAASAEEAIRAAEGMFAGAFGDAGRVVVVEEFLEGEEASFIVMADGKHVLPLATSQDHKRLGDGDAGPNTGGMGAYSPAPVVTPRMHERIMREVIDPTLAGLAAEGMPYTGFLYAGIMIAKDGTPNVLEFNCRFGDPETQPVLSRLRSDLVTLCEAALAGRLDTVQAEWDPRAALGVVLAARGYPDDPRTGDAIDGLDDAARLPGKVFHASTRADDGRVVTAGGRVLCAVGLGDGVAAAQRAAYALVDRIRWDGMQYRRDIGWRAL